MITISDRERTRIGLNGTKEYTHKTFGLRFSVADTVNFVDLNNLNYVYHISNEKRFFLAVVKHGIIFRKMNCSM